MFMFRLGATLFVLSMISEGWLKLKNTKYITLMVPFITRTIRKAKVYYVL